MSSGRSSIKRELEDEDGTPPTRGSLALAPAHDPLLLPSAARKEGQSQLHVVRMPGAMDLEVKKELVDENELNGPPPAKKTRAPANDNFVKLVSLRRKVEEASAALKKAAMELEEWMQQASEPELLKTSEVDKGIENVLLSVQSPEVPRLALALQKPDAATQPNAKKKVFALFGGRTVRQGRVEAGELAEIARVFGLAVAPSDVDEIRLSGSRVIGGQLATIFFSLTSKEQENQLVTKLRSGVFQRSLKLSGRGACTLEMDLKDAVHRKSSAITELLFEFSKGDATLSVSQNGLATADGHHIALVDLFEHNHFEAMKNVMSRFSRSARNSQMRTMIEKGGNKANLRALCSEFRINLTI